MDKTIIELLEKYLNEESLTKNEEQLMQELKAKKEFDEKKELMEDFLAAMDVFGTQQLKSEMESWRFEMEVAEMQGQAAPAEGGNFGSIPTAALEAHFAESPSYATAIRANNRNTSLVIEHPQNGFDWNQQTLEFKVQGHNGGDLKFQIEDNLHDSILDGAIQLDENKFALNLDWKNIHPGRYYLKVFNDKGMDLIDFFIRKDLMPDSEEIKDK